MARYQIILAYDGTCFAGFQRQVHKGQPVRTVQGELENALRRLGWQGKAILASGRTDSGVHASGQVIAFDLDWNHSPKDLQAALNANLPADLSARAVSAAEPGFHPRYDAKSRRYRYRIYCQAARDPLRDRYSWQVWPELDLSELNAAAEAFIGLHDFAAFGVPPRKHGTTIRQVYQSEWVADRGELIFEITANAFLFRMVRRVVYAQVGVCRKQLTLAEILDKLAGRSSEMVQGIAPACGLELVEVRY